MPMAPSLLSMFSRVAEWMCLVFSLLLEFIHDKTSRLSLSGLHYLLKEVEAQPVVAWSSFSLLVPGLSTRVPCTVPGANPDVKMVSIVILSLDDVS